MIPEQPRGLGIGFEWPWHKGANRDARSLKGAVRAGRQMNPFTPSQDARSSELRATASLARLLAKQGRPDEARMILAEIYGWFS
jgi:hypothetical protein